MTANLSHELATNLWGTLGWLFLIVFVAVNGLIIALLVTAAVRDHIDRRRGRDEDVPTPPEPTRPNPGVPERRRRRASFTPRIGGER